MTTPTPLPCPFCGAFAWACEMPAELHGVDVVEHWVCCRTPGCNASIGSHLTEADAVAAWNKAPRESPRDHLAERMRNARRRGRRVLARRRSR